MIDDPRTVLVTGAMGQIGKRVTAILLDRGATVVALDLRTDATMTVASTLARRAVPTDRLLPVYVDLTDKDAVEALVAGGEPAARRRRARRRAGVRQRRRPRRPDQRHDPAHRRHRS